MNRILKRMAAALMIAVLMLGSLSVLAEPLAIPQVKGFDARIKTDTSMTIDPTILTALISMVSQQGTSADSEMQNLVLTEVLNAINKLTITSVSDGTVSYATVGTESGEVFDMYVSLRDGENYMITSMFPGLEIDIPVAQMPSMPQMQDVQSALEQNWEAIFERLIPYGQALIEYTQQEVLPKAQEETGSFDLEGIDVFDGKVIFEAKTHMVAGLLEKLLDMFKNDKPMQDAVDKGIGMIVNQAKASGQLTQEPMDVSNVNSGELIKSLEESIARIQGEADETFAKLEIFSSSQTESFSIQAELMEDEKPVSLVSFSVVPSEAGDHVRFSVLFGESSEEGPTDWAALREGMINGSEYSAILFEADFVMKTDEAAKHEEMTGSIYFNMMGMQIGLSIDNSVSTDGEQAVESTVALSVLSPSPLLVVKSKGYETTEDIPSPDRNGLKKIQLTESMGEEDEAILIESFMTGLPQLLERLKAALPEEGPMLAAIIEGMMNPGTVQTN